jgi:hypothetical protein
MSLWQQEEILEMLCQEAELQVNEGQTSYQFVVAFAVHPICPSSQVSKAGFGTTPVIWSTTLPLW